MTELPHSPAAERNKGPILDVLRTLLPAKGTALEIASGTGQHVEWFAAALPDWEWQPTDAQAESIAGIAQRIESAGLRNVRAPVLLDVLSSPWPAGPFDAIYCANMLHISPWSTCAALMRGAAECLARDGVLVIYGPFLEDAVHTAPGNVAFDRSLRGRDPAWGIRRLEDVAAEAQRAGLRLVRRVAMPANNLVVAFS